MLANECRIARGNWLPKTVAACVGIRATPDKSGKLSGMQARGCREEKS